jgi:hypothetical protein
MKKLHKIIAISIQKKATIAEYQSLIYKWKGHYYSCYNCTYSLKEAIPQQLLLLSDEEIKKNDWYYNERLNSIYQAIAQSGYNTTDKEIKIIASYPSIENLSTFSKEFIKDWILNPVKEVEVEYETEWTEDIECTKTWIS